MFNEALANAREGGASAQQLAELEDAEILGEIDLETARAATRRTVKCIQDSGYSAEYADAEVNGGRIVPSFSVETDGEVQAQSCEARESYWVLNLFATQASALEADRAYFEQQRPILLACMEENGIDVAADDDIYALLEQALQERMAGGSFNCLRQAGIDGF